MPPSALTPSSQVLPLHLKRAPVDVSSLCARLLDPDFVLCRLAREEGWKRFFWRGRVCCGASHWGMGVGGWGWRWSGGILLCVCVCACECTRKWIRLTHQRMLSGKHSEQAVLYSNIDNCSSQCSALLPVWTCLYRIKLYVHPQMRWNQKVGVTLTSHSGILLIPHTNGS